MSSSTLQINKIVDASSLPPQCDFILPGYNTLLYTDDSDFKNDFVQIQTDIGFSSIELNLFSGDCEEGFYKDKWARDFITCKTSQEAYVLNPTIPVYVDVNPNIIVYNSNITPSIFENAESIFIFDNQNFKYKSTNIISAGGNIFHCVNTRGESYAIVGEVALTSQMRVDLTGEFRNQMTLENPKTGSKSIKKYHDAPNIVPSEQSEQLAKQREWNKKILKTQLGKDTALVIVPNSLEWHIDVEMAVLPNGVVLLHSFDKTLNLLDKYKDIIPNYDELYQKTQELVITSQPLFAKTKRKLEK